MIKIGNYRIIRFDERNFALEVYHKHKKEDKMIWSKIGYFGSFKQAVNSMANYTVLNDEVNVILEKLDKISKKLDELDVKIVCKELSKPKKGGRNK